MEGNKKKKKKLLTPVSLCWGVRARLHTADFDRNKAADRFSKDKLSTAITLTMIVYIRQCECEHCVVRFFVVICLQGVMRFEKKTRAKALNKCSLVKKRLDGRAEQI